MKFIILSSLLFLSISTKAQNMSHQVRKNTIIKTYNDLRATNLEILDGFYAKDVEFHDPVGMIKGLKNIKDYYSSMYQNVKNIKFSFSHFISQENEIVGFWKMTYQTNSLNAGKPIVVTGNSHLKFNSEDKVYYHRDFFDMGEMVYEHIPVAGYVVRKIKEKL